MTSGAEQDSSHVGNISWGRLGDVVEAEAGLGAHGAVRGHSNFGGRAGGGHDEVVCHKMKLILSSVVLGINLNVVSIVDLLIDIFIHLCRNFRFVSNSYMEGMNSFRRTKIILTETGKVWFVETINSNLALDGVHDGVVHDGLDVLLLGDLEELLPIGRGGEFFC